SETDEVDGAVLSSETILRGVSGREVLEELQLDDDELSSSKHEARIMVVPNMLPTYIPLRLAQKILFIGESVQMLKDTENLKIHHYDENIGNLLQGRENDFLKTLHDLQERQEFSIPALEVEVDKIKACVAEQLWKLVVEDADLIKHLKLLKEMYLLGRGELYLTLIDHLHTTMKGPPTTVMSYDISAAFKQSLAKILTYSEEYEDLFELKLDMKTDDQTSNEKFKSTWDLLQVQYNPPWPLHLLFTPSIMEKLNMLFTFLLKVRRTQIELQGLWAFLMSAKRSGKIKMTSGPIWVLRRRMAFFIDNLQYYLQVDVLETQFSLLISKIHKTQSFENINRSLDNFLIEMLKQSFVSMKKVFNILHEIIYHCMAFCETVTSSDDLWDTSSKTEERIERIAEEYNKQTSLLFTILSSVRSHQTSPHLAQLLLRIDFNKFFTKKSAISMTSSSSSSSKDLL
uniref:Gamma-tubulin complex component n=1 Tax=Clytia hemisphaerica TaxID=252671 RepID=A0A7M5X4M2_9CNID